jgi:hypothetical protein
MKLWRSANLAWLGALLLYFSALVTGCHSRQADAGPQIEFIKIPPNAQGGRERVDTISGRVTGWRPGQHIVIYARSGPWWVQLWPDQYLVPIQSDSTWSTPTHLGFEYAALLVDPGYKPPPTMDVPPSQGGPVVTVKIVKGVGPTQYAYSKPLHFSGYDWAVRTIRADRGGMNNPYDPDNVFTDAGGALHLGITKKDDVWNCSELHLTRSLGYGTYVLTMRDTSKLEAAAIFSMHTWDDFGDQHYREMDVEIGRWGDSANKNNAQYGIQPFYVPGNLAEFSQPAGTLTHSLRWESGRASFKTVRGSTMSATAPVVYEHVFTSGVPTAGDANIVMDLCLVPSKTPLQNQAEVIVDKFEYLP